VNEINVRDKHTIEFKLAEPRPPNFIMSAFASGWNVIVRKKTLEDNQQNLRRVVDIPGTGPFKSKRRVENEVWVMERNPNYWNKEVAYLDGILSIVLLLLVATVLIDSVRRWMRILALKRTGLTEVPLAVDPAPDPAPAGIAAPEPSL
jgi:ABC-type oligopeptide transport system substrate-binding subunit